jgi:GNAT superfamily N-acetyltransferase
MASGAVRLVLWSDTRFERAHRFYEKWSYVRHGGVRILHDISNSLEFGYAKPVDAIEALDVAAATSAVGGLAGILIACVAEGASVSYLPSLMPDTANAFWQRAAMEVGTGKRVIVAAWRHGALVGTGMLNLATAETQSHLGVVQTILVDPGSRRAGLGRRILRALEAAAVLQGRSLLTLDSRAGDASEGLCRAEGWREAGRIPGFVKDADGTAHPTIFFWKEIGV